MLRRLRLRFLAGQFARPSGLAGRTILGPWLDRISRSMNELVFDQLALRPGETVLEVGFGGGDLLLRMLAVPETRVLAVDLSDAMVARARRRFRRACSEGRLRVLKGDAADRIPVMDRSLQALCTVNTIYFWPDPAAAMRELARILGTGGRLLVALETPESLRSWPGHRYGFSIYDGAEVKALMEDAGFRDIGIAAGSSEAIPQFLCLKGIRA